MIDMCIGYRCFKLSNPSAGLRQLISFLQTLYPHPLWKQIFPPILAGAPCSRDEKACDMRASSSTTRRLNASLYFADSLTMTDSFHQSK